MLIENVEIHVKPITEIFQSKDEIQNINLNLNSTMNQSFN